MREVAESLVHQDDLVAGSAELDFGTDELVFQHRRGRRLRCRLHLLEFSSVGVVAAGIGLRMNRSALESFYMLSLIYKNVLT